VRAYCCLFDVGEIRAKQVSGCRRDHAPPVSTRLLRDRVAYWKNTVEFFSRNQTMPLVPLKGG
jgi:hypothetical protein